MPVQSVTTTAVPTQTISLIDSLAHLYREEVNSGNSVYLSMQNSGGAFTFFFNNSAKSPPGRAEQGANHLQLGTTSVDLSQPPPVVAQATPRSNTDQLVTRPPLTPTPVANLATPLSVHTAAVSPTPTTTQEGATTRATTKKRKLQTPPKADQQPTAPKASTPEVFRTSEIQGDIQLSLMSPDGHGNQEDDSNVETGEEEDEDKEDEAIEEVSALSEIRLESEIFPPIDLTS